MVLTSDHLDKKNIRKIEYKGEDSFSNSMSKLPLQGGMSDSIFMASISDFSNWSRLSSLWPLLYGTSCCFIEFASLIGSRFDFDRYGLVPRSSPRQADLIVTAGTITMKMAPSLIRLYEQMPEPKYVIAMGACTITGGMFSTDSYSTVRGVDKLIPVDIYLPGCPPKPEAIMDAVTKLRKKIARNRFVNRASRPIRTKYFSISHQLNLVPGTCAGKYNWDRENCGTKLAPANFSENCQKFANEHDELKSAI
uniref:NAD(P)H-quinone oxidoreductase subunit K, chloroplastic n=2 Tax=Adiantum capillus-veneris TaxID=13818 RepID=NDHK_ADICA|nr:RecName: Full=NAD(P)H-quinone oxidoreductase subunit K, chloroplastic; AltName: Full=NAD(P)H dehydrogenase subunit K; AltName: Full=NADH-plastoquinone oxidoreductase subunit K [Adiantum capillus-veneris]AAP29396.2 NADH dehydrogenase subunit K [Adiantum capillus-veneris]